MGYQPTARRVTLREFIDVAKSQKWTRETLTFVLNTTVVLGGGTLRVGKTWYRIIDLPLKRIGNEAAKRV